MTGRPAETQTRDAELLGRLIREHVWNLRHEPAPEVGDAFIAEVDDVDALRLAEAIVADPRYRGQEANATNPGEGYGGDRPTPGHAVEGEQGRKLFAVVWKLICCAK